MNKMLLVGAAGAGVLALALSAKAVEGGQGNIVVTEFFVDRTTCTTRPCTVTGSVKWQNQGSAPASFIPSIKVNGVAEAIDTVKTLDPDAYYSAAFQRTVNENTILCPG